MRLKICSLIKNYLEMLKNTSAVQLDDDFFFKLQVSIGERMLDKNFEVQKLAIQTSHVLQLPNEKYCSIISTYVHILKHESIVDIKLLVLDLIVINNFTFDFLINYLIYDTNVVVRNKVLNLIEKKVPVKFFDSQLKKQLINCALNNKNDEMLEKFLIKWLNHNDNRVKDSTNNNEKIQFNHYAFLKSLDLANKWYESLDFKDINAVDKKLFKVSNIVFKHLIQSFGILSLIQNISQLINNNWENLMNDLNLAFYFRSLLHYYFMNNEISLLESNMNFEFDEFCFIVKKSIEVQNESLEKQNSLICFYLIDSIYYLNLDTLSLDNDNKLINDLLNDLLNDLMDNISFSNKNLSLFELIFSKYEPEPLVDYIFKYYCNFDHSEKDEVKKFFLILISFLSKINGEDFINFESLVENMTMEVDDITCAKQNKVEYLVENFVLKHISDLDPSMRALSVRALGLAASSCYTIAESFYDLFSKVL